jgi:methyltransferase
MLTSAVVSAVALGVVLVIMLAELRLSSRHERDLRRRGALEPADPVYGTMRWAYPGVFVAMAVEGALFGPAPGTATAAGAVVLIASKALKAWAIATLGERWTYRVLVLPAAPLVTSGPYRLMRHPNYLGVVGELLGMALLTGSRVMGPMGILFFAALLRRRIAAEERALGRR